MLDQNRDLHLIFQKYWDKASKGNGYAMMYVADCFLYGWGTEIDINQYKACLNQAASMGVVKALERLFYEALGMQNFPEVERILLAWSRLSPAGRYALVNNYEKTIEIYKSLPQKSVQGMLAAFSEDEFSSEWDCEVAMCYQFGYGVEKNSEKAAEIIINHLGTQYDFADEIANILGLYGTGEISKTQMGEHLYELMCKVDIYDTLDSVEHPNGEAGYQERLIVFAACSGNVRSQIQMAHLYLGDGIGYISKNEYADNIEALRWLLTSLNNGGDDEVLPALVLLADKLGEKGDYENAFKAWYASAEFGFIPAQKIVGTYYYNGDGVAKDYIQAGQWWLRAAENGDEDAIKNVNTITEIGNGDFWVGINALIAEDSRNNSNTNSNIYPSNNGVQARNNGGQTQTSGGCYVATCVYGSYDCPEVWTFRRFRDYYLAKTWSGRLFIKIYYATSPTIVRLFGKYVFFKKFWRIPLDKMAIKLEEKGFKSTKYDDRNWD